MADTGMQLTPLIRRISRIVENLQKKGPANITATAIQIRLDLLETLWREYQEKYHETSSAATSDSKLQSFLQTPFDNVLEVYLDQKTHLCGLLLATRSSDDKSTEKQEEFSEAREYAALPKIPLPPFSGRPSEWRSFCNSFTSEVIQNQFLRDVERFQYLKMYLGGDAARLIRHIPTTEENFKYAWEALVREYENHWFFVRNQLQNLWRLPAVQRESSRQLKTLLDSTWDAVKSLSELGRPVVSSADWLVYLTVEKLDGRTRRLWERHIEDSFEVPTLEKLRKFLEIRIDFINFEKGLAQRAQAERAWERVENASKTCLLCKDKHFLLYCPSFRDMDAVGRRLAVTELNMCTNCLGRHSVETCTNVECCQVCTDRHHTMLHEAYVTDGAVKTGSEVSSVTKNQKPASLWWSAVEESERKLGKDVQLTGTSEAGAKEEDVTDNSSDTTAETESVDSETSKRNRFDDYLERSCAEKLDRFHNPNSFYRTHCYYCCENIKEYEDCKHCGAGWS